MHLTQEGTTGSVIIIIKPLLKNLAYAPEKSIKCMIINTGLYLL